MMFGPGLASTLHSTRHRPEAAADARHDRTRPGPGGTAALALVVSLYILVALTGPSQQPSGVATHRITADCFTGEDLAERYGYQGDWRQYTHDVRKLNGWEQWPLLQLGQRILVPDYRGRAGEGEGPFLRLLDRAGPPTVEER